MCPLGWWPYQLMAMWYFTHTLLDCHTATGTIILQWFNYDDIKLTTLTVCVVLLHKTKTTFSRKAWLYFKIWDIDSPLLKSETLRYICEHILFSVQNLHFFLKYNFFSLFSILRIPLIFNFILLWVIKSSCTLLFTIGLGKGGNPILDGGNLIFASRLPDGQPHFIRSC